MLTIARDLADATYALRRSAPFRRVTRGATLAACALLVACGHARGAFVWADDVRVAAPEGGYRIASGDVLAVRVWNQEPISMPRVRVREDGRISLPFLHDVEAGGLTPTDLASALEAKLKAFVVNPVVTVSVEEPRPLRVSVVGEVTRPGAYDVGPHAGVLQALAAAGGLTEFADLDGIFVLRRPPGAAAPSRVRFRYRALARGEMPAAGFTLCGGDVVVVE